VQLAARPPARDAHALVYDPLRRRTVLFGGRSAAFTHFGDTWEWDGAAWTFVPAMGPAAGGAVGTYDSAMPRVVVIDRLEQPVSD
jgi:hypothetical protein